MRADLRVGADTGAFLYTRVLERDTEGISQAVPIEGVSRSSVEHISGSGEVEGVKHVDRRSVNPVTSRSDAEDEDAEASGDFTKVGLRVLSAWVWNPSQTGKVRGEAEDLCDEGSSV